MLDRTETAPRQLTATRIAKLIAKGKPGRYPDGRVPGLYFALSRTSGRSWVLRYKRNGPQREMGLGPLDLVSIEDAREKALRLWRDILDGRDPIDEGAERAAVVAKSILFRECAALYIEAHRAGWKNKKHVDQWISTLATYADPIVGHLPVAKIDTALAPRGSRRPRHRSGSAPTFPAIRARRGRSGGKR
jgi:hypothetical protein